MKKVITTVLIVLLAFMMISCGGKKDETAAAAAPAAENNDIIVIANDAMSEKFSPFFAESVPDQNIVDSTQINLLYTNRNGSYVYDGIKGETVSYNGTDYTYTGPATLKVTENPDGSVYYDYTMREDLKCADGTLLTADDLIFSFYVFCDPTYDGAASVYSLPIQGMEEYRSGMSTLSSLLAAAGEGNTDFSYWSKEQSDAFWAAVNDGGTAFAQGIVDYCVNNGYNEPGDVVGAAANWGFGGLPAGSTAKDLFLMIGDAYGWNFTAMEAEVGESDALADLIPADVYAYSTIGVSTGTSAPSITGIQKTGDFSVRVTLTEVNAPADGLMDIQIVPLHWYGDKSKYDYKASRFGFDKGDLSGVRAKTTTPMGAGPYKFVKYENKTVYLEANPYYYKGEPKTKYLQWKETGETDKVPGVIQGTIDMSDPSVSKAKLEQIAKENSNGQLKGNKLAIDLVDYNGYGYIGINAVNVKVGDDRASEASKNLRKALATIICVYRDVTIDSYYGNAASVINYPISNCSWAAPQKSDAGYKVAFSTDVNGNPIYTSGMTEDQKYDAALKASLEYFKAAGYTVSDGKITAAPAGAKMAYTLMIGGDGVGDHPSFGIVTQAKDSLAKIGFTLEIDDLTDTSKLWDALESETAELWCAAWSATLDPDMYQIYHSDGGSAGHYGIRQPELDALVLEGRGSTNQAFRKAVYKEALDYIVDFAVEVPVYQRQEGHLYSTERIDMNSIPADTTTYYYYLYELEKLALKH